MSLTSDNDKRVRIKFTGIIGRITSQTVTGRYMIEHANGKGNTNTCRRGFEYLPPKKSWNVLEA